MTLFLRILGALVLAAVVAFSCFGFLAAGEYAAMADRLPWYIGYGVVGLAALAGIIALLKPRSPRA